MEGHACFAAQVTASEVAQGEPGSLLGLTNGKSVVTPLLLALVCVEVSDVLFAVDSIPAVFGTPGAVKRKKRALARARSGRFAEAIDRRPLCPTSSSMAPRDS